MKKNYKIEEGLAYPLGLTKTLDGINIAIDIKNKNNCGVVFYDGETNSEIERIEFQENSLTGSIACMKLVGNFPDQIGYSFYDQEGTFRDPYGKDFQGKISKIEQEQFLWNKDEPLRIPFEDSVFYLLHVKGFTKHSSSKVSHGGTFLGVSEKAAYLKDLGITAVELMPAYEFDALDTIDREQYSIAQAMQTYHLPMQTTFYDKLKNGYNIETKIEPEKKINYWGYKKGYYFAPNNAYSATKDSVTEFKQMVKTLHLEGIEVIMQFYFPKDIRPGFILEVLKYWVVQFHVDGFHLKGEKIPMLLIATEPMLTKTKLLYENMEEEVFERADIQNRSNLCAYNDQYMLEMRKFLKGDENQLNTFMYLLNRHPQKEGAINYFTNYYGFTLADMVSYECKHNENNGEENRDGMEFNYTWNCGTEGKTTKRKILQLRKKQMTNALTILFLSQGTPLITGGDEFARTQDGNNNPYCQDNEISWINWSLKTANKEIYLYTKEMIAFRKNNRIFHMQQALRQMDYKSYGYPDVSFHGENAWEMNFHPFHRSIGVLYCNKYIENDNSFYYIAYNMGWDTRKFALPRLPRNFQWEIIRDTAENVKDTEISVLRKSETVELQIPARSICILKGTDKK